MNTTKISECNQPFQYVNKLQLNQLIRYLYQIEHVKPLKCQERKQQTNPDQHCRYRLLVCIT